MVLCTKEGCRRKCGYTCISLCSGCNKQFCSYHRLGEYHECEKQNEVNKKKIEDLQKKLLEESTHSNRGLDPI